MGGMPSITSQMPLGTPGGSFATLGARSPYSFCMRSHAAGGSFTWLSAEISLKSGIIPFLFCLCGDCVQTPYACLDWAPHERPMEVIFDLAQGKQFRLAKDSKPARRHD